MLSWALRYLALAVVVAGGVAMFQGSGWLEQATAARNAKPSIARNPPRASATHDAWESVIEAGEHGHFVIEATVNGEPITFLVDTGASDIVLTPEDAQAIGLEPQRLDFSRRFRTANGVVHAAPVSLRELRIGQFSLYDLDAVVNEASIGISLLGMSFLERLGSYEVADGRLILRW